MYLFSITIGADEGDIADIVEFDIHNEDDVLTLYHKNCIVSSRMFIEFLPKILNGTIKLIKQPKNKSPFFTKKISSKWRYQLGGICCSNNQFS